MLDDLKDNKFVWAAVCVFIFIASNMLMIPIVSHKVERDLLKGYSPAKPPYGPGVNPDRINPDAFNQSQDEEDQDYQPRRFSRER